VQPAVFREIRFEDSFSRSRNNHFSRAREAQRVERGNLAEFGVGSTGVAFRGTRTRYVTR